MVTGAVSTRYAKALFRYTEETGGGERVAQQALELLKDPSAQNVKLEPELERFIALVSGNGRMDEVRMMLRSYIRMYYRSRGWHLAHLTVAVPSPELETKLKEILQKQFDCKVEMVTKVDPSLIGGFIIEITDHMLDASVRNQVETLRRQFIIQNNRIV